MISTAAFEQRRENLVIAGVVDLRLQNNRRGEEEIPVGTGAVFEMKRWVQYLYALAACKRVRT
jgi:hypothetical protein